MLKVIPFLLTLVLTACGGGGGGSIPQPQSNSFTVGGVAFDNAYDIVPTLTKGDFVGDGGNYILVTGWLVGSPSSNTGNPAPPVKIFKLTNDGTSVDVTAGILGSNVTASVNAPIVADFNGDGIDDIFLAGFKDMPSFTSGSVAFISQPGQAHRRIDFSEPVWSHAVYTADLNGDGFKDIVNQAGQMWINDGHGNFTFRDHSWNLNTSNNIWMNGSGVCAGDFNNTGRAQIVITDLMTDSQLTPIADTVIFELNNNLIPTTAHTLPVPIYDRGTVAEASHDVACRVADLNGDGLPDIVVSSRPWDSARNGVWTDEGRIQILINQGNWQFTDVTDAALSGYQTNIQSSYNFIVTDLNGDNLPDLWVGTFSSAGSASNLAFINNGNGGFNRAPDAVTKQYSNIVLPVKFGSTWGFVTAELTSRGLLSIKMSRPNWQF